MFLSAASAAAICTAFPKPSTAQSQDATDTAPADFSFDSLSQMAQERAGKPDPQPEPLADFLAGLDYDSYQLIEFKRDHARWAPEKDGPPSDWRLLPFHIGWLFQAPVAIYEVEDGKAVPMTFSTEDFNYRGKLADEVPADFQLPGVAGFKLTHPLNRPDVLDEVIAFVGASYFRALGEGNAYGLSARGLAIDSGLSKAEEFPRFSAFWVQRPGPTDDRVTIHALLDSASCTGAYRFVVTPGADTTVEVTARLYFRKDVEQLGIAPLTSMFLFAGVNRHNFDDFRPQVHDSDGLRIRRQDGDVIWRALDNPSRLASSYFTEQQPLRFGLHQRARGFDRYQDAGARYDLRPSLDVEPLGDWGPGVIRLVEIPSDLEIHDNIGAFWIPSDPVKAGQSREYSYRLHWGMLPADPESDLALVSETLSGVGGAAGLENPPDTRKFVVDFDGGMLGRLPADDEEIEPVVNASGGKVDVLTLSKLPGQEAWRLTCDISAESGAVVELTAHVAGYGRKLSEIWAFQWIKP